MNIPQTESGNNSHSLMAQNGLEQALLGSKDFAVQELRLESRVMRRLVGVIQELSLARTLDGVMAVVRRAARDLTGSDGATFVLREGDDCFYADEEAIGPLW